ncbi:MAG: NAD(P)-dependent alcohol dehydrogenase [Myxococcales bacterium]|nr:NAD(P)-dependent alcohol dehydrogenase [Polyangiaceae bacterium]MDW8249053.1 NAD(P)-dependent alcohol dehydrogenase [Myxococcales bacterium]
MRAVEFDRFGGSKVLEIREVPEPVPRDTQVLVQVRAAALNPKDILARIGKFRMFSGLTFPRRVGYDWAGEVVQVGAKVSTFRVGDAIHGMFPAWSRGGACAEYIAVDAAYGARIPKGLSFEEAAAIPLAGLTAWQTLRNLGRVGPGSRVLIHGASGGVGTFAVQIARALGARVVAVCGPENQDVCRELGADRVLDYRSEDPCHCGEIFDLFFDVFGNRSRKEVEPVLAPEGLYVSTIPSPSLLIDAVRTSFSAQRGRLILVRPNARDLEALDTLVMQGKVRVVLDQVFSLEEIAAAQDRVATQHARGKVVVRVGSYR